jgi:hypothetical protein
VGTNRWVDDRLHLDWLSRRRGLCCLEGTIGLDSARAVDESCSCAGGLSFFGSSGLFGRWMLSMRGCVG